MDRRVILKGFGGMIGWSRRLRRHLVHPVVANYLRSEVESAAAIESKPPVSATLTAGMGNHVRDIRNLTQHFIGATDDVSPWMFVPQHNIKSLSTTEHPGFLTIWHGDKGEDIKGILKDPIKIDDYPTPWEFHLGLGQYRSSELPVQSNYAFGLNIGLTFSDPSTWPENRTQPPKDMHSTQILVVHLRLPQLKASALNFYDPGSDCPPTEGRGRQKCSEVYLVYGRGDLDQSVVGNWNVG